MKLRIKSLTTGRDYGAFEAATQAEAMEALAQQIARDEHVPIDRVRGILSEGRYAAYPEGARVCAMPRWAGPEDDLPAPPCSQQPARPQRLMAAVVLVSVVVGVAIGWIWSVGR